MKNNKGITIVELITVVAIMAILTAGTITYVGMLGSSQVKKCTRNIEYSLSQTKTIALSKTSASMVLYADDTGVYVKTIYNGTEEVEQVGKAGLTVNYYVTRSRDTAINVGTTAGDGLLLTFDRSSGAMKKLADGTYCYGIEVEGGTTSLMIVIEPLTGKFSIE